MDVILNITEMKAAMLDEILEKYKNPSVDDEEVHALITGIETALSWIGVAQK